MQVKMKNFKSKPNDDPVTLELRRQKFIDQAQMIGRLLEENGISEEQMLNDFAKWRKDRRKNPSSKC
jgi:hypothetical protein